MAAVHIGVARNPAGNTRARRAKGHVLARRDIRTTHEYFVGQMKNAQRKRAAKLPGPFEREGVPDTGRIVKLFVGQGHGVIRLANDREIYFHRADLLEGTSFNDFSVGDVVTFDRLDDRVSGARALRVVKRRPRRG
ncbi:MAG TPA: hypothetical protein VM818_18395 [Vicinamibacterales bacterium]|nr:hypothetical protein [Vicinamibacterales bacterium]